MNDLLAAAALTALSQKEAKAKSKKQQRFMGMVRAAQKGEKPASEEVSEAAESMSEEDTKDYAETEHEGLPEKKEDKSEKEAAQQDSIDRLIQNLQDVSKNSLEQADLYDKSPRPALIPAATWTQMLKNIRTESATVDKNIAELGEDLTRRKDLAMGEGKRQGRWQGAAAGAAGGIALTGLAALILSKRRGKGTVPEAAPLPQGNEPQGDESEKEAALTSFLKSATNELSPNISVPTTGALGVSQPSMHPDDIDTAQQQEKTGKRMVVPGYDDKPARAITPPPDMMAVVDDTLSSREKTALQKVARTTPKGWNPGTEQIAEKYRPGIHLEPGQPQRIHFVGVDGLQGSAPMMVDIDTTDLPHRKVAVLQKIATVLSMRKKADNILQTAHDPAPKMNIPLDPDKAFDVGPLPSIPKGRGSQVDIDAAVNSIKFPSYDELVSGTTNDIMESVYPDKRRLLGTAAITLALITAAGGAGIYAASRKNKKSKQEDQDKQKEPAKDK
jgi:hypothetical protein